MQHLYHKPLIIEFIGGPGSGKTTVARELLPLLEHRLTVDTYIKRFVKVKNNHFAFLPKYRKYVAYGITCFVKLHHLYRIARLVSSFNIERRHRRRFLGPLLRMYVAVETLYRTRKDTEVIMLDRGYVNSVATLVYRGQFSTEMLDDLFSLLYDRHQLILVSLQTEATISVERILARAPKGDYIEKLSPTEALEDYKARTECLNTLLTKIMFFAEVPVFKVSGDLNATDNAKNIASFLVDFKNTKMVF